MEPAIQPRTEDARRAAALVSVLTLGSRRVVHDPLASGVLLVAVSHYRTHTRTRRPFAAGFSDVTVRSEGRKPAARSERVSAADTTLGFSLLRLMPVCSALYRRSSASRTVPLHA